MIHVHIVLEFIVLMPLLGYLVSCIVTLWKWRKHGTYAWGIVFKSEVRVFELWPKAVVFTLLIWFISGMLEFFKYVKVGW